MGRRQEIELQEKQMENLQVIVLNWWKRCWTIGMYFLQEYREWISWILNTTTRTRKSRPLLLEMKTMKIWNTNYIEL